MNKNIKPYNEKHQRHGYWEVYWSNSEAWYKAFYHNDNEISYEENPERYKKYYI